jgi:SAM-dependent methyltransferase
MTTTDKAHSPGIGLYERMGERTTQPFAVQLLDRLMPLADRSLIDVAAGTGGLAVVAAERGAHVLATDIAPAMVERAAERLRSFGEARAEVMDFQALAVDDARYDLAISHFGVLAFATWRTGLDEMVRVTRPDGRIALVMWTHEDDCSPAHLMRRVFKQSYPDRELWPADLFPVFSKEALRASLRDAGAVEVDVDVAEQDWSPYSSADVVNECDPMFRSFPGYAALSADEAVTLRASLQSAFDSYADSAGVIRLPTRAFMITARRPK